MYNEIRNALESSLECSGSSLDTPSRMITLLQFDAPVLIAVICIVLLSGLIHGTLGLGFPMVATPLLATMMDVRSAILITLLPTMAVNITSIVSSESRLATASRFWPLIGFAALGTVIGSSALATTDPAPFRILLAALILLYLWNGLHIPRRWLADNALAAMALFGLIAGMAAGTTNVMVAVLIIYFLSLETARATLIPALNSCFLVGKISQIAVLASAGLVSLRLVFETAPLALAAVVALLLGQRLQSRIQVATYQAILRKLLLLLAIVLIFQFLNEAGLIEWAGEF